MNDNMEFLDASGEMSELFNSSGAVEDLTAAGGFSFGGDGFSDPFAEEDETLAESASPEAQPESSQPEPPADTQHEAPEQEQPPKAPEPAIRDAAKSGNPLATLKKAEQEQAPEQKAEKERRTLFDQAAVFRFEGKECEIENPDLSFEQLRIQMADRFVVLDERKKVAWKISYGKTRKSVPDVNKSIREEREQIEASGEFLESLKRIKDKSSIRCYVEPYVSTPSKGAASCGVAAALSLEEALENPAGICILPARSEKVLELRKTDAGHFITEMRGRTYLPEAEAGYHPALPPVPYSCLSQIIDFFRSLAREGRELEALVYLYWDKEREEYHTVVPRQEVTRVSVTGHIRAEETLPPERFIHVMDIHSHNNMKAEFSPVDDANELETRVYVVIGELQKPFPSVRARISNNGSFLPIPLEQIFLPPEPSFPPHWTASLSGFQREGAA